MTDLTSNVVSQYVTMLTAANGRHAASETFDAEHAATCLMVRDVIGSKIDTAKGLKARFIAAGESIDSLPGAAAVRFGHENTVGYAYTVGIALSLPVDDDDAETACPVTSETFLSKVRSAVENYGKGGMAKVRSAVVGAANPAAAYAAVVKIDGAARKVKAEQKAAEKAAKDAEKAAALEALLSEDADDDAAETVAETIDAADDAETFSAPVDADDAGRKVLVLLQQAAFLLENGATITPDLADVLAVLAGMVTVTAAA
jgi:hypothetical protein